VSTSQNHTPNPPPPTTPHHPLHRVREVQTARTQLAEANTAVEGLKTQLAALETENKDLKAVNADLNHTVCDSCLGASLSLLPECVCWRGAGSLCVQSESVFWQSGCLDHR
jgi:hypothetical protein